MKKKIIFKYLFCFVFDVVLLENIVFNFSYFLERERERKFYHSYSFTHDEMFFLQIIIKKN